MNRGKWVLRCLSEGSTIRRRPQGWLGHCKFAHLPNVYRCFWLLIIHLSCESLQLTKSAIFTSERRVTLHCRNHCRAIQSSYWYWLLSYVTLERIHVWCFGEGCRLDCNSEEDLARYNKKRTTIHRKIQTTIRRFSCEGTKGMSQEHSTRLGGLDHHCHILWTLHRDMKLRLGKESKIWYYLSRIYDLMIRIYSIS